MARDACSPRYVAGKTMDRHLRSRCRRAQPGVPAGDRFGARTRRQAALCRCRAGASGERDGRGRTHIGGWLCSPSATARRLAARAWRWRAAGWPAWPRRATSACRRRTNRQRGRHWRRRWHFRMHCGGCSGRSGCGLASLADETIVCRCEEVTAGQLRAEMAGGLTSLAVLKKATRAGMGRCQGRFCAATIARLCPGYA